MPFLSTLLTVILKTRESTYLVFLFSRLLTRKEFLFLREHSMMATVPIRKFSSKT